MLERLLAHAPAAVLRSAPAFILIVLSTVTVLVWRNQVAHEQALLARHTEDVAFQSRRRLEELVESRLRIATILGRRWAGHASHERSRERFVTYADLLTGEMRTFDGVALIAPDARSGWVTPADTEMLTTLTGPDGARLLSELRAAGDIVLSGPYPPGHAEGGFYALQSVDTEHEQLGYLGVHFNARDLMHECFHEAILAEFEITLADAGTTIFHATRRMPDPGGWGYLRLIDDLVVPPRAEVEVKVRNRRWSLSMSPLRTVQAGTWTGHLAVPRLGLLMSVGLAVAAYVLIARTRTAQKTRDEALAQIAERQRIESALRRSEARFRNVFASATDGLVVVDKDGSVLEANAAAAAICGCEPEAMLGRPVYELYGRECEWRWRQFLTSAAPALPRFECSSTRPDGQSIAIEMRATRLRQDDAADVLVIVTDVTERRRALERHAMLSRKVLVAQEEERARVSRELHDELGQLLTAIRLEMGWFKKRIDSDSEVDMDMFHEAVKLVERAADESRRICRALRPPLLDDLGLEPAVRLLVDEFKEHTQVRTSLDLAVDEGVMVPHEVALCTYRILQESLTNVSRHARAKTAQVTMRVIPERVELEVVDDGVGFDPERRHGCGIEGMGERSNLVNGTLLIHSSPGGGTRVVFVVPLPRREPTAPPEELTA